MSSQPNHRGVLVLGTGLIAQELATAYRHLGWNPTTVPYVSEVETLSNWSHVAVADPDIDTAALRELTEQAQRESAQDSGVVIDADGTIEGNAEALGGPRVVPSVRTCMMTADRAALRATADDELGLPTLAHELVLDAGEVDDAADRIGFPLVIKPRHGSEQNIVETPDELAEADLLNPFAEDGVVLERYIDFDYEVTILTARSVDPKTGELATWFCEPIGTRHVAGKLVESWQPAPLPDGVRDNAHSIAARITGALESYGLFAIELFVDGEEVYFSRVLPMPGLAGMLTRATQRLDQFALQARAAMHLPIDVTLISPGASQLVRHVAATPDHLAKAMAVEETSVQVVGENVLVHCTGESVEEARARAARAAAALEK